MAATTATERDPVRRRPGGRRAAILAAALELFSRQGYQETGIDEIGAAAGVSGPAIYRHFGSKQELLAAAFMDSFDRRRTQIRERLAGATVAAERLELIVRDTVENTLDERQVLTLYTRELRHLPRDMRAPVQRKQQELTNDWVTVLGDVHPHLSSSEARMAVVCVHSLIATLATTDGGMDRDDLEGMLVAMSLAALGAAGGTAA
ncbi:MAG TPA: TetR/AcrR family transcriptional regulator [Mycobacteriales bacterium]|nr:TetR/AcrR family transcriptional regulator [Mycobacteriales bacterium]